MPKTKRENFPQFFMNQKIDLNGTWQLRWNDGERAPAFCSSHFPIQNRSGIICR